MFYYTIDYVGFLSNAINDMYMYLIEARKVSMIYLYDSLTK